MPRGVPANGYRKRRGPLASAAQEAAAQLAGSTVDDASGDEMPAEVQTDATPDSAPASAGVSDDGVPFPDGEELIEAPMVEELTEDQQRIRALEWQVAQLLGRKDDVPQIEPVAMPGDEGNILIHILEDGFSALGHVWYRGQELEFEPGGRAHKDTYDRVGNSWLDLRNDEFAQVERYGLVMFRNGPWPGKRYADAAKVGFEPVRNSDGSLVAPPSEEELAAAEKAEAKRKRAAPHLSSTV